ncbi:unnamed protein product [Ceratitis capitata]|uniref:(Mediterranean fruit fly) hypothetical protein n=1 Tax=Ceratitis capitata TaxID=7213 RepID=A0A811V7M3_CERCA|nr:unnamed protein product [Ceratitis capitata]
MCVPYPNWGSMAAFSSVTVVGCCCCTLLPSSTGVASISPNCMGAAALSLSNVVGCNSADCSADATLSAAADCSPTCSSPSAPVSPSRRTKPNISNILRLTVFSCAASTETYADF